METVCAVSAPDSLLLSLHSHQQRLHCGGGAGATGSGGLLAQVRSFSVSLFSCVQSAGGSAVLKSTSRLSLLLQNHWTPRNVELYFSVSSLTGSTSLTQ